jgi:hypothetical protein
MAIHSPQEFATALGAKLATRSRHVCAFVGAGAAKACGLPDVKGLETSVQAKLVGAELDAFNRLLDGRNIEKVLSRLRRIAGLVSGTETVDSLSAAQAEDLDKSVCQAIVGALDIGAANLAPMSHLAAWAARADYRHPVEIFTVNYDLLLETALEGHGVPYFDGFVGNLRARFRTDLVEAPLGDPGGYVASRFVRLWKLHGSVNWVRSDDGQIVRMGQPAKDLPAAIYPSDAKYEESRRVPFLVLQDRLRRALHQPETIVLVSGFSFTDDHLNEMLFDAAIRRERSEFVVFSHDDISDDLAKRARRTPNIQVVGRGEAILGGVRGKWEAPDDDIPDLWEDGKLALPDFTHLASYLARSSTQDGEGYGDA